MLRWLRFQLEPRPAVPPADADAARVSKIHLHFGFGSAGFRQQLFQGLEWLLSIEAAQHSLAAWPDLATWLRDNDPARVRWSS